MRGFKITDAVRMATYDAESTLARILATGGRFPMDDARALMREAMNAPGDLEVAAGAIAVRLGPLSAPRRIRAVAALCEQLTAAETTYPVHRPRPALRGQRRRSRCMNFVTMSGALERQSFFSIAIGPGTRRMSPLAWWEFG